MLPPGTSLLDRVRVGCSLVAALIGAVTILGWLTGMESLASLRAHYIPMAPSTALSFALMGFAIMAQSRTRWLRFASLACTAFVAAVALAKLFEFFAGFGLGFDALFVADPGNFGMVQKGRMAPLTALNFLLATSALHFARSEKSRRYAGLMATLVTAISVIVLMGYLHGTPFLYGGSIIPVALTTAVAFFFLGCSLVATAGQGCWPLRPLSGPSASSLLLRWFLPVVIAGTIANDYLQTRFVEGSHFNPALISSLAALAFTLLISAIISQVARVVGGQIDRAVADRNAAQEELEALNKDLDGRITARTQELSAKNEELQGVLADLTRAHEELKRAQLQLIQAEKMQSVGSLAAGVAHEVKNPLAILEMGLGCLMSQPNLDAESFQVVHREMREAVSRANSVISGLLEYSSSKELDIHSCSLHAVLESSLHLVRHECVNRKIMVVRDFAPAFPPCEIDKIKIEQVFINLFTNACHAMPNGGTLSITTAIKSLAASDVQWEAGDRSGNRFRLDEHVAEVRICDTGKGIPPEKLDQIFDPFFTTKPTGLGTGLGLTVARKIVDLHGGRLELGNAPGGGAVATILFHLRQAIL